MYYIIAILLPFLVLNLPLLLMFFNNPGECFTSDALLLSASLLIFTVISFIGTDLLFKKPLRTSFFLSICFISGGIVTNSFSFVVINFIWLCSFIAAVIFTVADIKYRFLRIQHLTVFLFPLVAISVYYLVGIYLAKLEINDDITKYTAFQEKFYQDNKRTSTTNITKKPNIYYIVLDEFVSEIAFKNYYHINGISLFDFLRNKGFTVINNSYSNYPWTIPSLSSSLNMVYHEQLSDKKAFPALAHHMIKNNLISKLLLLEDYNIFMQPSVYWLGKQEKDIFKDFFIRSRSYGLTLSYLQLTPLAYLARNYQRLNHREYTINQLAFLRNSINLKEPFFIYSHILCPHRPIVFRKDGRALSAVEAKMAEKDKNHEWYLEQAYFIANAIEETINSILENSKEPPIIVLQSDHGRFPIGYSGKGKSFIPLEIISWRFSNLNALYLPDKNHCQLPSHFSPVNNFRLIFNLYFSYNFPMLEDRCFYDSYDFSKYYLPKDLKKHQSLLIPQSD